MTQCIYCSSEAKILSEKINASGDLKTIELSCGHTNTVAIVQSLSRLSTSELQKKLGYSKRLVKLHNITKGTRDNAQNYIVLLEAELKDRRA